MAESELYAGVQIYLDTVFSEAIKPRSKRSVAISSITATAGPYASGTWSRPDLALVSIWYHRFSAMINLDLYGFEVKPVVASSITGVYEAYAHTRFVNYSYFVLQVPVRPISLRPPDDVYAACAECGVGLITLAEASDTNSFRLHLKANRAMPDDGVIDNFIETRFSEADQNRILSVLPSKGF